MTSKICVFLRSLYYTRNTFIACIMYECKSKYLSKTCDRVVSIMLVRWVVTSQVVKNVNYSASANYDDYTSGGRSLKRRSRLLPDDWRARRLHTSLTCKRDGTSATVGERRMATAQHLISIPITSLWRSGIESLVVVLRWAAMLLSIVYIEILHLLNLNWTRLTTSCY